MVIRKSKRGLEARKRKRRVKKEGNTKSLVNEKEDKHETIYSMSDAFKTWAIMALHNYSL